MGLSRQLHALFGMWDCLATGTRGPWFCLGQNLSQRIGRNGLETFDARWVVAALAYCLDRCGWDRADHGHLSENSVDTLWPRLAVYLVRLDSKTRLLATLPARRIPAHTQANQRDFPMKKLFVGNLDFNVTEDQPRNMS